MINTMNNKTKCYKGQYIKNGIEYQFFNPIKKCYCNSGKCKYTAKGDNMKTNNQKDEFQKITEDLLMSFLKLDIDKLDKDTIKKFHLLREKAKLGMAYLRDRNTNNRIEKGITIGLVRLVSANRDEIKEFVRSQIPEFKLLKNVNK